MYNIEGIFMKRKMVFLLNPTSGTKTKEDLKNYLIRRTSAAGFRWQFLDSRADGNYDELKPEINEKIISDVVVVGGDGTVSAVAESLMGLDVNIGIIPVGSGNGLARAAGIPMKPSKALDIIFNNRSKLIDGFYINRQFSCMLSGIGFDAAVAHSFAKKSKRGLYTYTKESLLQFFKAEPFQFEIILPNFSFYSDAFFISIANGNQFGNNFTIAPKASLNDGLIDIVIVQKMPKAALPFAIIKQISGNNELEEMVEKISKKNIVYFQVPNITIKNINNAPLHVDGDPKETAEIFDIQIVPNALRLLMP